MYAQTSDTTLQATYRADSVHTPVELYKQETVLLNTLFRELQLCDSLRKLDAKELGIEKERSKLIYEDLKTQKTKTEMWRQNAENKDKKLKRNRKGFAVCAGLIIVRLGIRLGLGV